MRFGGSLFSLAFMMVLAACSAVDSSVHTTRWDDEPVRADTTTTTPPPTSTLPPFVTEPLARDAPRTFVDDAKLAMVLIQTGRSQGTGWVVAVQGNKRIVVTNHHVVAPALGKRGADGRIRGFFLTSIGNPSGADATVLAADKTRDLAILKLEMNDPRIKSLRLADSVVAEKQRVVVVGFPFGNMNAGAENASPSLNVGDTDGEVVKRFGNTFMKVTAGIHPGNSGGPVLDGKGNVIGVATLQEYTKASLASGVRFNHAIPVADVIAFAKKKKIDLKSTSAVGGTFAPEAVAADTSEARKALAYVDVGGARLACAVIANGNEVGSWLMCDPLGTNRTTKGTATFPASAKATPQPASLVTHRDGFSLFQSTYVAGVPVAVLARSSTLRELDVLKRVRVVDGGAGNAMFSETGIRVSSVRKDRSDTTAVQLLVDPGIDDTSRAGGVYLTSTGIFVGIEADAAPGTNLRAVLPADVAWPIIDEAAAPLVARGHRVRDDVAGIEAIFPRLAARLDTRYGDDSTAAGVGYRSVGGGTVCSVEAWPQAPEPIEALLGRPLANTTSSRVASDATAVIRVDAMKGGEQRRIVDGARFVRVNLRGATDRCSVQLLPTTGARTNVEQWATALRTHLEQKTTTTTATTTTASVKQEGSAIDSADDVEVCGVWSWPKVRSPDRTWVARFPCGAARRQTLSGGLVITKMVARPSPLHRFEVASWSTAANREDIDRATSSYDEIIDDYILTNLADTQLASIGAHTDGARATKIQIVDGDEVLDEASAMVQSGTLRDGRRVLALVTMTRGQVVHVAMAIVPKADMKRAQQFIGTFKLHVDTDNGPAIRLDARSTPSRPQAGSN